MRPSAKVNDGRWKAVLLLGPTGSGKTPLGEALGKEGLSGSRCLHFDFGEALRASVDPESTVLTPAERAMVHESLRTGALLENKHFSIAEKLLEGRLSERNSTPDTIVVLNGLPRHSGQAEAMDRVVDMLAVVSLECAPATVWERIRADSGGDRGGRVDDTREEVRRRIELFRERTAPLLSYYRGLRVPLLSLDVGIKTTAHEMRQHLEAEWTHAVDRW